MFFTSSDGKINLSLAIFTSDYVEGTMDSVEKRVFEEYLSTDPGMAEYVRKVDMGKKALRNTYRVKAADDFEEKLARRIARIKNRSKDISSA